MKKYILFFSLFFLVIPAIVFAQYGTVDDFIYQFYNFLMKLLSIVTPLAFAVFLWHLIKFIRASSSGDTNLAKDRDMLIYSGIIIFVMVGIWTIVGYIQMSVGADITTTNIREIPATPMSIF